MQCKEVPPAELAGVHRSYAGVSGAGFSAAHITPANFANTRNGDATKSPDTSTIEDRSQTGQPHQSVSRCAISTATGLSRRSRSAAFTRIQY
jgi:hypothetical protein